TAAGGQAASFSAQNVVNNISAPTAPVYSGATVENATPSRVDLTYNLTLANIVPAASAFTVRVNTVARTVSSVTISGNRVLLTLASPVVYGDAVTVAYTKPSSNPLQTAAGGQAASFSAQNVVNNVGAVNQPPAISIASPTKSTSYVAPATITIDAVASDPDGSVIKVEFYQGTVKLGEVSSAPYSYTWKEVAEGSYSITAAATDNQNRRTVSAAVTVVVEKSSTTVNQLPVVTITSPSKGKSKKYRKGEEITITAEAEDPDGTISKVEFKSGDIVLAEVTSAPYTFSYAPSDTGHVFITASATDNYGAVSVSESIDLLIGFPTDNYSEFISLYPNPNDGRFTVEAGPEIPAGRLVIRIAGLNGVIIHEEVMDDMVRTNNVDISHSPSGSYILMLIRGKEIIATRKLLKLR
ncbi:MAG TPA: Ig-like domain-containing protein, partial [Bacteroidales bacterium]|nr:Ig-like domain-containing protein [Bacteroidales bacterium]